jgi:Ca-activated chloride channel family protein
MDVYPSTFPDIFAGNEIIVLGRFRGEGEVNAHLHGRRGDTPVDHAFTSEFSPDRKTYPFVAKLWAGRRIGYLLDQIRLSGESAEVKDEVVRLSKKYGIMTPYTSFLAAPEEVRVAMRQDAAMGGAPVSLPSSPAGHEQIQMDQATTRGAIESSKLKAGRTAVFGMLPSAGDDESAKKETEVSVSGRRFTLLNGVWTDWNAVQSTGAVKDTLVIKPYSPAYFKLASNTEIAAILAVGDKVIFLWRNTLIRIDESGVSVWNSQWSGLL